MSENKIIEKTNRINATLGEGDLTVSDISFETEEGVTFRYFDRNKRKERSFSDTLVFEKVEVIENNE